MRALRLVGNVAQAIRPKFADVCLGVAPQHAERHQVPVQLEGDQAKVPEARDHGRAETEHDEDVVISIIRTLALPAVLQARSEAPVHAVLGVGNQLPFERVIIPKHRVNNLAHKRLLLLPRRTQRFGLLIGRGLHGVAAKMVQHKRREAFDGHVGFRFPYHTQVAQGLGPILARFKGRADPLVHNKELRHATLHALKQPLRMRTERGHEHVHGWARPLVRLCPERFLLLLHLVDVLEHALQSGVAIAGRHASTSVKSS